MVLNARRQELIKILEANIHNTPLTINKLSNILGVSHRTIRYDLDIVDDALCKKGFMLHKKANKGVWVENTDVNEVVDSRTSRLTESYDYVLSKKERCNAIIVYILDRKAPIATEHLADKLIVSRSTLIADLESVRIFLEKYNLLLCSKRGLGLWIEGREEEIRKALVEIFASSVHDFSSMDISEEGCAYEAELFHEYAKEIPVKEIAEFFIKVIEENHLPYNDFSINYMVISLSVQLQRLHMEKQLTNLSSQIFDDHSSVFLNGLSTKIAVNLSQYNERFCNSLEVAFITFQLLSSKISFFSQLDENERTAANLLALNLAEAFVKSCQTWLGDIYSDDEELLYGLALHLQPAIQRAKCGIKLTNPMLPQIREQYYELFMITMKTVKEIEQKLGTELSEDEIGYLTIHFGAAIERKKIRSLKKLKVLLVCGNGIGTAKLLSITLKSRMPYLDITKVISMYEWKQQDLTNIDLVISTIPLKVKDAAVLHVSPILSDTEIQVIENQIQYFYNKKFTSVDKSGSQKGMTALKDVLLPETVELDVKADDWEEAIAVAGRLLVNTGGIEARYIDSMINCVKKIGPYIVIAPGIAMPHSRPEDGVKKICLSMVRLATPVSFSSLKNDPVDLVFAFGAVDYESHFRVLSELWQILNDPSAIQILRSCKDKTQILALASCYSAKSVDE